MTKELLTAVSATITRPAGDIRTSSARQATREFLGRARTIGTVWAITRVLLVMCITNVISYPHSWNLLFDVRLYHTWSHTLANGNFPAHDTSWQYPPGAAVFMLLPRVIPGHYNVAFVITAVIADCAAMTVLLRRTRGEASPLGAWMWVVAPVLLGPIIEARFDLMATAMAMAALLLITRPFAFGALVGAGALTKVWPVLLLIGTPPGRSGRRMLKVFAAFAVIATVLIALLTKDALSFVRFQGERGLQVESVAASGFLIVRLFGVHMKIHHQYGASEIIDGPVGPVADVLLLLTALGLGLLVYWRLRAARRGAAWSITFGYDAALAATLVSMVTSRVLSPQYLIWVIGLAAVCLTRRDTTQRLTALLILLATPLTQAEFPMLNVGSNRPLDVSVLALRNALLVAATVVALRGLARAYRKQLTTAAPALAREPGTKVGERHRVGG